MVGSDGVQQHALAHECNLLALVGLLRRGKDKSSACVYDGWTGSRHPAVSWRGAAREEGARPQADLEND